MSDNEGSAPPREELASRGFVKGLCLGLAIGSALAAFGFVAIATRRDESGWLRGAVWCFGGGVLTVAVVALTQTSRVLAARLLTELREDGPLRFEKHWGGLGGASSGWSLSRSFTALLALTLALAALLAILNQVQAFGVELLKSAAPRPDSSANGVASAAGSAATGPTAPTPKKNGAVLAATPVTSASAPEPSLPVSSAVPAASGAPNPPARPAPAAPALQPKVVGSAGG